MDPTGAAKGGVDPFHGKGSIGHSLRSGYIMCEESCLSHQYILTVLRVKRIANEVACYEMNDSSEAVLLVDASNAFNSLNCKVALRNIPTPLPHPIPYPTHNSNRYQSC